MSNRLDKIFKDKLAEQQFQPTEQDWQSALNFIQSQEDQDKRRRGAFWWFTGIGLIIVLAAFVLLFLNQEIETPINIENDKTLIKKNEIPIAQNDSQITQRSENKPLVADEKGQEETVQSKNQLITNEFKIKANTDDLTNKIVSIDQQESNVEAAREISYSDQANQNVNIAQQKNKLDQDATKSEVISDGTIDLESNTLQKRELLARAGDLDILNSLIALEDYELSPELDIQPKDSRIFPVRKTSSGLGAVLNLGQDELSTRLSAGIYFESSLSNKLGLKIQALYGVTSNINRIIKQEEIRTFSFRSRNSKFEMTAERAHFVSIPISLSYRLADNHKVSFIAVAEYLLGVKGTIDELNSENQMESRQAWLIDDPYNRLVPNLGLAYEFEVSKGFSLGLSMNYRLKGMANTNYELDNNVDLQMNNRLNGQLSVFKRLF